MNRLRKGSFAIWPVLVVALGSQAANAHEFWIEPSTFTVEPGARVNIRLCVGDGFEGWSLARNAQRIEKFVAAGPVGEQPIVGLDGSEPAGIARFMTPGGYVIVYRSNRAFTEMPAAKFDEYLKDKGLEKIIALRGKSDANRPVEREAYSRNSKSLIRVGNEGVVVDRRMGLRLELIAETDQSRSEGNELHSYQLLYEGRPLAGALVTATRPGTTDGDLKIHTDATGRASLRLPDPGMWRVAAVHMVKAPGNLVADWESLWASLTFEIPLRPSEFVPRAGARSDAACRNKALPSATQARS